MDEWVYIIESKIASYIKNGFPTDLIDRYHPNFTTEEKSNNEPRLPTIYTHLLAPIEQGQDLQAQTINAILATVQVKVTTNGSKQQARQLAYGVVGVLKSLGFDIIALPETIKESENVAYANIRARRMIGSGDLF